MSRKQRKKGLQFIRGQPVNPRSGGSATAGGELTAKNIGPLWGSQRCTHTDHQRAVFGIGYQGCVRQVRLVAGHLVGKNTDDSP